MINLLRVDQPNSKEAQFHQKRIQAEAEVVPSLSLVEVEVEVGVEVGVEVRFEV